MSSVLVARNPPIFQSERADVQLVGAAQAGLNGVGNHLLQRRIGDQESRDDAGMRRIGAAQFQRRRRAVGFGIAGIGRHRRRDLVGGADDRIEAVEGLVAVEGGADLIFKRDAARR